MTGTLARDHVHADDTPLDTWCSAVFSVLVDVCAVVDPEKVEDLADRLADPIPGEDREDLDPETWGMSEQAQEAQQRLLDSFGQQAPVS